MIDAGPLKAASYVVTCRAVLFDGHAFQSRSLPASADGLDGDDAQEDVSRRDVQNGRTAFPPTGCAQRESGDGGIRHG